MSKGATLSNVRREPASMANEGFRYGEIKQGGTAKRKLSPLTGGGSFFLAKDPMCGKGVVLWNPT